MFSLSDSVRYWLYTEPTDMRKSYDTLSGIVTDRMCGRLLSGDAFVFLNRRRNLIKILRWEPGGLVLYSKRLEEGTFRRPPASGSPGSSAESSGMEWRDLVVMVEGIRERSGGRRRRMEKPPGV